MRGLGGRWVFRCECFVVGGRGVGEGGFEGRLAFLLLLFFERLVGMGWMSTCI